MRISFVNDAQILDFNRLGKQTSKVMVSTLEIVDLSHWKNQLFAVRHQLLQHFVKVRQFRRIVHVLEQVLEFLGYAQVFEGDLTKNSVIHGSEVLARVAHHSCVISPKLLDGCAVSRHTVNTVVSEQVFLE